MKRTLLVTIVVVAGFAPALIAQGLAVARVGSFVERYTFDAGLVFKNVTQYTVPVGVDIQLGRFATLALSTGYVRVELDAEDQSALSDQTLEGALDSQARLAINVIPGRLVLLATGAVPTGIGRVRQEELAILGIIASDIIGFTASDLGNGGNIGGGFVGAFPIGKFAFGLGATFQELLSYDPVVGEQASLKPGREVRVRGGIEGPLARRTYLRVAGVYAARAKDEVGGQTQNGVGDRIVAYVSLDQAIGASSLSIYGYDVHRSDPQIETTAIGAGLLPRSNLFVGGVRLDIPVGPKATIAPRGEFRNSLAAPDTSNTKLRLAGRSVRLGVDIRGQLDRRFAVILRGDGITGFVVQDGHIGFRGFRISLNVELVP